MLVLSRKVGQRVVIDRRIVVTVVEASADRVKLAFDAPLEVPIHREEVIQRMEHRAELPVPSPRTVAVDESAFFPEFA